jgi:endoglucanase
MLGGMMNRRDFICMQAAGAFSLWSALGANEEATPSAAKLPIWRGFNLLEKFNHARQDRFRQQDFEWIKEWGFDFVRLPLSYRCWSEGDPALWLQMREEILEEIDEAVAFGRRNGVHVNLNFHRAPGYCVNPPAEPLDLWTSEQALEASAHHWAHFARRYRGIPNHQLSFDLLNEPARIDEEVYVRVMRRLVEAIRAEDPDRLIVADGLSWGNVPVHGLVDLGVAQSTRGYQPMRISHYRASWIQGSDTWPEPQWPLTVDEGEIWDRQRLKRDMIQPWKELETKGVGIHVGEWGVFRHTPHPVALAWMQDCLELWKSAGWGWALWNFRGTFGILDSQREDIKYEPFRGHDLDRAMLELLRSY